MDLMRKITRKDPSMIPNEEKTLCDQFSQNVQDVMLRKHLKQIVRQQPDIPFLDLREEAIMWSEEEEYSDQRTSVRFDRKFTTIKSEEPLVERFENITINEKPDKFKQLFDIVSKQSEQIDTLTKMVNSQKHSSYQHVRSGRVQQQQQYQQYRPPLCYGCRKPGHKVADCPDNPNSGK